MKWLLYSKKFKANLCKWIFMYIGVMCCLTSVITYSRYISNLQSETQAQVAKFNVSINYMNTCSDVNPTESCNYGVIRPTANKSDFYFSVDTSELEVSTTVYTYVYIKRAYAKSFKLYETDSTFTQNKQELTETTRTSNNLYDYFKITDVVNAGNGKIKYYHVVLEYDKNNDPYFQAKTPYKNILYVDYSAIQND